MGNHPQRFIQVPGTLHVIVPVCISLMLSVMLFFPQSTTSASVSSIPKLLLVSFDGFRWNYLSKLPESRLPNFQAFINKGSHVRWVENVFPTFTRPNHMSMISGLYVESHGIVQNHFFDPALNAEWPRNLTESDAKWVDLGAEPIWVTNSKAGSGRLSGSVYWPTSSAPFKGYVPDKSIPGHWSETTPEYKIDLAFDWLTQESNPVNFVAMYSGNPDHISHEYGPDSDEVLDIIVSRDKLVERILSKIKEKGLEDELNVIITADHGHAPVYNQTVINLDLLVDPSLYKTYQKVQDGSAMVMLTPKEGYLETVVENLSKHPNLHVLVKGKSKDLVDLHYSNNRRIAPLVLYGEQGWLIGTNETSFLSGKGEHGWDPRYAPSMYPFFMAMGPAFKKGLRNAEPFHIVDIYPLMCHILGLTPAPNNGSLSNTAHILSVSVVGSTYNYIGIVIGILIVIAAVITILCIVRSFRKKKNVTATYKRTFTEESTKDMMPDGVVAFRDDDDP